MKVNSLYIHVPFCLRKCNYCDFASLPLPGREDKLAAYPDLLRSELELWRDRLDFSRLNTVYFGGGTPSLLSAESVGRILSLIGTTSHAQEITLEANPGTVQTAGLQKLREKGINRLSFGVQSFNDNFLSAMGRAHTAQQAVDAVAMARQAGFDNISIDLIYGLPNQTLVHWATDLDVALSLDVEHISLYSLSLSEQTPWGRLLAAGQLTVPDDDAAADMLELAVERMEQHGYRHYEISNFGRPGKESRHNLSYWRRDNYLGLGMAACSCLCDQRLANVDDYDDYARLIAENKLPWADAESLTMDQIMSEAMFLGLRMADGVDVTAFEQCYGISPLKLFKKELKRLSSNGLLEFDQSNIRLTKRGFMLGNQAFAEFV